MAAAALAGALVARASGEGVYGMAPQAFGAFVSLSAYGLYAGLGLAAAVFGIGVMRLAAVIERIAGKLPVAKAFRPAIGGLILIVLALYSPQTLSSGHGALRQDLAVAPALTVILILLLLKASASIISLGFGFRGGLFFASLFLGSLLGRAYAIGLNLLPWGATMLNPTVGALVGMSALAVAVIGGPFTMTFLVLETTGDFGITTAALAASLVSSLVVRETFGYSFSTWRLHLRGETIRSAHDVGFLRTLTAGTMMRATPASIAAGASLAEARHRFPLGSVKQVVITDDAGAYAGLLPIDALYAESAEPAKAAPTVGAPGAAQGRDPVAADDHPGDDGAVRPHQGRRADGGRSGGPAAGPGVGSLCDTEICRRIGEGSQRPDWRELKSSAHIQRRRSSTAASTEFPRMALSRRAALSLAIAALFAAPALAQPSQPIPIPRRGGAVPPEVMQAGPIANYQALHLRKPPTGYGWYHIGPLLRDGVGVQWADRGSGGALGAQAAARR